MSRRKRRTQEPLAALSLPDWLPAPVAEFVRSSHVLPLTSGIWKNAKSRERLRRLTTDARMRPVWSQLAQEIPLVLSRIHNGEAASLPVDFPSRIGAAKIGEDEDNTFTAALLRGYLYSALVADIRATYWSHAPGAQEQHDTMLRIGECARELIGLLADPCLHYQFTPWDRLDAAVPLGRGAPASVRELFDELTEATRERYWSGPSGAPFFPPARALLGDLMAHRSSQLGALAVLADLSVADQDGKRRKPPNKTKNLLSTVYVRDLARYADDSGLRARQPKSQQAGFPLYQVIADTANVALALSGTDELCGEDVRKLVANDR